MTKQWDINDVGKLYTRPWGTYRTIEQEKNYQIKHIVVFPGKRLSYQYHEKRSEAWTIVQGIGTITLDGIKNDFLPGSNFNYSAELTEMALIGVLSQRFGGRIDYDSKKMEITNRPELNRFLKEEARDGWKVSEFYNSLK